jgi:hypothetical protein
VKHGNLRGTRPWSVGGGRGELSCTGGSQKYGAACPRAPAQRDESHRLGRWKASESSIEPRNSTQAVFASNAGKLSRFVLARTGHDPESLFAVANPAIDRQTHLFGLPWPNPSGPTKIAQLSHSLRASSIAGRHEAPGIKFHWSSQAWSLLFREAGVLPIRPCYDAMRKENVGGHFAATLPADP